MKSDPTILSAGIYIPSGRLPRARIAAAWSLPSSPGWRSVAGPDEDALTMAVEAGYRALGQQSEIDVEAVYFATTSPPYLGKENAGILVAALDLPEDVRIAEFSGGPRAGVAALHAAFDSVASGSTRAALIIASERSVHAPGSSAEQLAGDGAVAIVVGRGNGIATVRGWATRQEDLSASWRGPTRTIASSFEPRLEIKRGYGNTLPSVCRRAIEIAMLTPDEVSLVAIAGPDRRAPHSVVGSLGMDSKVIASPEFPDVGDLGCASPLLLLAALIESSERGNSVLIGVYGDGADAVVFRREAEEIEPLWDSLQDAHEMTSYESYLQDRGLIEEPDTGGEPDVSPVSYWRNRDVVLRRKGGRCTLCGTVQFPPSQTCVACRKRGGIQPHRVSSAGTVFTFTNDHLVGGRYLNRPLTRVVLEMDDGCRIFTSMTDCDPAEIRIGMDVVTVFRRRGVSGDFINYGWKCKPGRV